MCHIHVGYDNPNPSDSISLVKWIDNMVGLMSVLFDRDRKRRSLYGKAGCFRLTSYGVEARILSAKMYDTNELMSLTWDGVMAAITSHNLGYSIGPEFSNSVVNAINNSDKRSATQLLKELRGYNIDKSVNSYLDKVLSS